MNRMKYGGKEAGKLLMGFALLFTVVCCQEPRNGEPEEIRVERVLQEAQILDMGLIFINARFNGVEGMFVFDTGAGLHTISSDYYKEVSKGSKAISDLPLFSGFRHNGERLDLPIDRLDSLRIPGLTELNPVVAISEKFNSHPTGISGILSAKLIEEAPIVIDFASGDVFLPTAQDVQSFEARGVSLKLSLKKDRDKSIALFFDLLLPDKSLAEMKFDTGTPFNNLLLRPRYMEQFDLEKSDPNIETSVYTSAFGLADTVFTAEVEALTLTEGTLKLDKPSVGFKGSLIYDGLTGAGFFQDKKLLIDIPNERLIVAEK